MSQTKETKDEAPDGYKWIQLGPKILLVPIDWKIKRIDEITENLDRKREPIKSSKRESGDVPYYGATGQVDSVSGHLFDEKLVLVGEDGADWSPFGGTSYIISGKNWVNNHAHVLRCTDIIEEFLSNYLDYIEMRQVISGTNRGKLNQSELNQFPVLYPPLPEQRRIVEILSSVGEQIQQTDEVIEKLEELKRGLMQDLLFSGIDNSSFTEVSAGPKTFEIPKSWDLSNVGSVITRLREGMDETQNQDADGIPVTRIETISDRFVDFDSIGWISSYRDDFEEFKLKRGDILLSHKNSLDHIGKTAQFWSGRELYHGENLLLLRFNKEIIHPLFAFYFLNTDLVDQICRSWARRFVSQVTLNQHEVEALPMVIPPKSEQKRISDTIFCVDTKIETEKNQKNTLNEVKRGLMQDLLTGKVRVDPDT